MEQLNLPAWDGGAVAESEYIAAPWRIAQGADALLPKEANGMLREHILQGGNGVSLDLTAGLYLETVEDMLELFDKVCPRDNPLNIYCGATPIPFLSLLKLRSLHLGYESRTYRGCAGGDPVGEYALRGKLPADMDCYLDQ
ncbi:MAG: methylmalonyl-CoA mutase family protein, partial [Clostridiales bacterium]